MHKSITLVLSLLQIFVGFFIEEIYSNYLELGKRRE